MMPAHWSSQEIRGNEKISSYGTTWNPLPATTQAVDDMIRSIIAAFNPFSGAQKNLHYLNSDLKRTQHEIKMLQDRLINLVIIQNSPTASKFDKEQAWQDVKTIMQHLDIAARNGNEIAQKALQAVEQRRKEWGISKLLPEWCVTM